MADIEQMKRALVNAHNAGDTEAARVIAQAIAAQRSTVSAEKAGREAPGWQQGLASVAQGPTFGFADEIGGAIGGAIDALKGKPFKQAYQENRNYLRGMQAQQAEENPWTTAITQGMAGAPLPLGKVGGLGRAALMGGTLGTVSGAGNSRQESAGGIAGDALTGGLIGMVASPALQAAGQGIATGGKWLGVKGGEAAARSGIPGIVDIGARLRDASGGSFADQKVAQALARDVLGDTAASGASPASAQVAAKFNRLGDNAALFDVGQNSRRALDTMATLPGRAANTTDQFLRQRMAGRGQSIIDSAEKSLGTGGRRFASTVEELADARARDAGPLYAAIRDEVVTVNDDLAQVLRRAAGQDKAARDLFRAQTGQSLERLTDLNPGDKVPFSVLDTLKQSLYDAASEAKRGGSGKMGVALDEVRKSLVKQLDDVSPKLPDGTSVYAKARATFEDKSRLIDMAELGRKSMRGDAVELASEMRGASATDLDAFRVGAFEALRDMAGTGGGQNKLMNMWREPATRERLKMVFGEERKFREFAADVARVERLNRSQNIGRGSQTASRAAGMADLDESAIPGLASAGVSASRGGLVETARKLQDTWARVSTPEPVRNKIAGLLMTGGQQGRDEIKRLSPLIDDITLANAGLLGPLRMLAIQQSGAYAPKGLLTD